MFSIYSSIYNLENLWLDWQESINRFCSFGDEVVIATVNNPEDYKPLQAYISNYPNKLKIIVTDFTFNEMDFDGKLKNAALKACTQPFTILLDGDEFISLRDKRKWIDWAERLSKTQDIDALFIPVVDLFHSEKEYKSVGKKWYLAKNLSNLNRGVVRFARKSNGKIDHTQSDTCELIYNDGTLVRSGATLYPHNFVTIDLLRDIPDSIHVWHTGWLDQQKRLLSNQFWQTHWNNRAGFEVKNIIHSKEQLDKIEYWPHGLRLWYE